MAQTGEMAPNFTLVSDTREAVSLADFRGKRVILYFYPKADTSGCTRQACAVRDIYPQIKDQDTVVIGISPDDPDALVKFREKHDLPFILLSDPDHEVAEAYGAWDSGHIIRSHFAVDEEGRLAEAEFKVKPETTADLALEFSL